MSTRVPLLALLVICVLMLAPAAAHAGEAEDLAAFNAKLNALDEAGDGSDEDYRELVGLAVKYLDNPGVTGATDDETDALHAADVAFAVWEWFEEYEPIIEHADRWLDNAEGEFRLMLLERKGLAMVWTGDITGARAVLDAMVEADPGSANYLGQEIMLQPGTRAPGFTLNDLHGEEHSLADFRGKYVLLDFWASWCGPCHQLGSERLMGLNDRYAGDLAIIGIGTPWRDDTVAKQVAAADRLNFPWVKLFDADGTVTASWYVDSIPYLVLLDPEGKVVMGGAGWDMIDAIESALVQAVDLAPGAEAPAFELPDIHGGRKSLTEFRGKYVLLDFWATWCVPCHSLMEERLIPLAEAFGDKGLVVLGIGAGPEWGGGETAEGQAADAERRGYEWTKLFDENDEVYARYAIASIPYLVLIGPDGKIIAAGTGWETIDAIEEEIRDRLED